MEIIGCLAAALIGVSLGLIGAGGGILTVPVMVYLFHISPVPATSYSLAVVGFTSAVGAVSKYRQGFVKIHTALLFGITSIVIVSVVRKWLITAIPDTLFTIGNLMVTHSLMTMLLFSVLMIISALSMIAATESDNPGKQWNTNSNAYLILCGTMVGLVTGILGAGGGFVLIPALVLLLKMEMKEAIGTSLLIITMNALVGFAVDLGHFNVNWKLLSGVTLLATAGLFIGSRLGKKMPARQLKMAFGWFVLIMGAGILVKELTSLFIKSSS